MQFASARRQPARRGGAPDGAPPILIWLNHPPQVDRGPVSVLAEIWPAPVRVFCAQELPSLRSNIGWGQIEETTTDKLSISILGTDDIRTLISELMMQYPGAIHLIGGFSGAARTYLDTILSLEPKPNLVVYTERPGVYGSLAMRMAKRLGLRFKYHLIAKRYRRVVRALLPLGELGLSAFHGFSWPREKLFNFMYAPEIAPVVGEPADLSETFNVPRTVRFLYVGRFSRFTKGTDVLLRAIDQLDPGDNWSLDLVGGYGDMSKEVIDWAEKKSNVEFIGRWTAPEVVQRMAEYDVCIVPSRFDGWNVTVNESISATRGVIVSDQAVSHELIRASGAGQVVAAGDAKALTNALQRVIDDPALIHRWSVLAAEYRSRISHQTIGRYLESILRFCFIDVAGGRPRPPWLDSKLSVVEDP